MLCWCLKFLIYLFQSLRVLKASDLKPYIVFISPPNIEKLKQLRQKQGVKVTVSYIFFKFINIFDKSLIFYFNMVNSNNIKQNKIIQEKFFCV